MLIILSTTSTTTKAMILTSRISETTPRVLRIVLTSRCTITFWINSIYPIYNIIFLIFHFIFIQPMLWIIMWRMRPLKLFNLEGFNDCCVCECIETRRTLFFLLRNQHRWNKIRYLKYSLDLFFDLIFLIFSQLSLSNNIIHDFLETLLIILLIFFIFIDCRNVFSWSGEF